MKHLTVRHKLHGSCLKFEIKSECSRAGLLSTSAAPAPSPAMMKAPGYWNSRPDSRPPGTPFFTAPMANDTCGARIHDMAAVTHCTANMLPLRSCCYRAVQDPCGCATQGLIAMEGANRA